MKKATATAVVTWNIGEALDVVKRLQPLARVFGYHIGICGGVINNGVSEKDLDLVVMRLRAPDDVDADLPAMLKAWRAEGAIFAERTTREDLDGGSAVLVDPMRPFYTGTIGGKRAEFFLFD